MRSDREGRTPFIVPARGSWGGGDIVNHRCRRQAEASEGQKGGGLALPRGGVTIEAHFSQCRSRPSDKKNP